MTSIDGRKGAAMRPEHDFLVGLAIPLAIAFGVWLGVDRARRFHMKLERHGVRLADWYADQPRPAVVAVNGEELA
jgi:hypothetical protein